MKIQEILARLINGNTRFVADLLEGKLQDSKRRESLLSGQNPFAIILNCSDSRVVPEFIFDTGLGELFTVRVAGNIANSSTIASIEYAVVNMESKLIVVMGHENCGAVSSAIDGGDNGTNLNHLLAHITPAISACKKDATIDDIVKKNAELTVNDLKNKSTILKEALDNGSIKIIPAYYNLGTGKVDFYKIN